ncbi:DUF309 domain-containing protein [Halorhabdus sp. CBA1104]|uniref:DUF309 domain-containing protein n=1 Tax=unclassified Halorhabdus TaxID=2621901 RepID=UPI0012B25E55|nr:MULTISPECIES: DUF309 domain-containing protein [unclassified Halorhabdus]QGN07581.1 DUF309 domain-containing protein [Halorhabdus sp. CBA1104]
MDTALRAGIALYNAGRYRTAHDAWEHDWIGMSDADERKDFLQGLIQFAVAIHHATSGNAAGAISLAEKAPTYLDGYGDAFAGVDLKPARSYLAAVREDPTVVDRREPPTLTHHGEAIALDDLDFDGTVLAADAIAESEGESEEALIEQAIEYARADLDAGEEGSQFVTFLFDYVREPQARAIVTQRLGEHVSRRQSREDDVSGLFE